MQQINDCACQQALLHYIDSISLVLVDISLYLDTHPCDREALKHFCHFKSLLKDARKEYAETYGPLTHNDVDATNNWTWVNSPWPWE